MIQPYFGPGLSAHEESEADFERRYEEASDDLWESTTNVVITWGHGSPWSMQDTLRFMTECENLLFYRKPTFIIDYSIEYPEATVAGIEEDHVRSWVEESVNRILCGESTGDRERKACISCMMEHKLR